VIRRIYGIGRPIQTEKAARKSMRISRWRATKLKHEAMTRLREKYVTE
jgi:hypothetical protein